MIDILGGENVAAATEVIIKLIIFYIRPFMCRLSQVHWLDLRLV